MCDKRIKLMVVPARHALCAMYGTLVTERVMAWTRTGLLSTSEAKSCSVDVASVTTTPCGTARMRSPMTDQSAGYEEGTL